MKENYYLPGSVTVAELEHLENLAKTTKNTIVEIGSFQGRSTVGLAKGSKNGNNAHIYAIDLWGNHKVTNDVYITKEIFLDNLKASNVSDIVTPIQSSSNDAYKNWDKEIGMLFIDGDHSYIGVKNDIRWTEFVVPGGLIAFHDYLSPKYDNSVIRAVNEVKDNWTFHSQVNGLIIFNK